MVYFLNHKDLILKNEGSSIVHLVKKNGVISNMGVRSGKIYLYHTNDLVVFKKYSCTYGIT
jgi:hypothetical protein